MTYYEHSILTNFYQTHVYILIWTIPGNRAMQVVPPCVLCVMQVALPLPGGQVSIELMQVANLSTNASDASWWPKWELMQVVPSGGQICRQ